MEGRLRQRLFLVGALIALGACNGDDGPSAQDQCDMLLDLSCDRVEECAPQEIPAGSQDPHRTCLEMTLLLIDCSKAVSVDASYDECIDQLGSLSCGVFVTTDAAGEPEAHLPASCNGVIKTR